MKYRIGSEYFGLIVADQRSDHNTHQLFDVLSSIDGQCWVLQSSKRIIVVIRAKQHHEVLFRWLSDSQRCVGGQTEIVGLLHGDQLAQNIPYTAFRIPTNAPAAKNIYKLFTNFHNNGFLFLDPVDTCMIALVPSTLLFGGTWIDVFSAHELDGALVVTHTLNKSSADSKPHGHKSKYDPLTSQIREIFGSQAEWLIEECDLLSEAASGLKMLCIRDTLHSIAKNIVQPVIQEGKAMEVNIKDRKTIALILHKVDMTAIIFNQVAQVLRQIRKILSDNGAHANIHSEARFSRRLQSATVSAARATIAEFSNRCMGEHCPSITLSYDSSFSILRMSNWLKYARSGVRSIVSSNDCNNTIHIPEVITLPDWCSGRFGALPILAHEVGHLASQQLLEQIQTKLINHLERVLSKDFPPPQNNNRFLYMETNLFMELQLQNEKNKRLSILNHWADEVVTDLIACAICGPAYLYSFARFLLGYLHEINSNSERFHETHPRMSSRLRTCEQALKFWGFNVNLESKYLPSDIPLLYNNDEIPSIIRRSTIRPYTTDEHYTAIHNIEKSLHRGEVLKASPTLLLNALWHSVVNKTGYANEIALAYSLINSDWHLNENPGSS